MQGISEVPRRALRDKRRPKFVDSDVLEPISLGIIGSQQGLQPGDLCQCMDTVIQEFRSPAQQASMHARSLTKFLNRINKRFKHYARQQDGLQEGINTQKLTPQQEKLYKAEKSSQNEKKTSNIGKEKSGTVSRKSKQFLDLKLIQDSASLQKMLAQNGIKGSQWPSHPALNSSLAEAHREKLQALLKQPYLTNQNLQYLSNYKNLNKNVTQQNEHLSHQQPTRESGDSGISEQTKLFKRSSYHVAIAYLIHIKNQKEKNSSKEHMDPTYEARRLKQQNQ